MVTIIIEAMHRSLGHYHGNQVLRDPVSFTLEFFVLVS